MSKNSDPNVRPFLYEMERIVDQLKERLPCCPNCEHWSAKLEHCTYQSQNVRPPAPVIAFGCWAFEPTVPF